MPGFSSFSDYINEVTTNAKSLQRIFSRITANGGAGVAYRWYDTYAATGIPGAGAYTGTGDDTQVKQSVQGCGLDIGANVSTDLRFLASLQAFSPTATLANSQLILVDFLMYYGSCVVTGTPTTLTNDSGLPRYTDGKGVMAMVTVQSALGATSPALTLTCRYNDDADAVSPFALTSPGASAPTTTLFLQSGQPFMALPAGKLGVKRINSYTLATGTTGTVAMWLVKPIAQIPLIAANVITERDFMSQIPGMPQIYDDAVLGFIINAGGAMVASAYIGGLANFVWG